MYNEEARVEGRSKGRRDTADYELSGDGKETERIHWKHKITVFRFGCFRAELFSYTYAK